ncbi:hypothetical protein O3P69_000559 [Scylla paramamosain]|uniref:Uncharacterized protein n=1 Tax=Scylla paramamosain TaxID=85552 RepID=A0AAW0UU56_SCYPA
MLCDLALTSNTRRGLHNISRTVKFPASICLYTGGVGHDRKCDTEQAKAEESLYLLGCIVGSVHWKTGRVLKAIAEQKAEVEQRWRRERMRRRGSRDLRGDLRVARRSKSKMTRQAEEHSPAHPHQREQGPGD